MAHLLLRVTIGDDPGAPSHDVVATVTERHTVAELQAALLDHLGVGDERLRTRVERTGRIAEPDVPLAELDLVSGDDITIGPDLVPVREVDGSPASGWALDITGGPESGRTLPLVVGTNTVGRSSSVDLVVADRSVSRRHATFTVCPGGLVTVVSRSATANGVTLDGRFVPPGEPTAVEPGSVIGLGSTRAAVRRVVPGGGERRVRLGQVDFHRTPYRPSHISGHEVRPVGPIPNRPEPRRLQLVAVLAPLIAGAGMYLLTRQAQFLLITLISPIVMVGTAVDDRRQGHRSYAGEVAAFRTMLATRREELDAIAACEAAERRRAAPDLAELVRRAEQRSIDLWQRGRDSPDCGRLRLGLGVDSVGHLVELEPGGDADLRREAERVLADADRLTDVPVTVDVTRHPLGVHGPGDLVRGVVASVVVQAATLHSPDDLTIVAGVSPTRRLEWTKWLPHLRSVTSPVAGAHLAVDGVGADALVSRLTEVAEFRIAGESPGRVAPWPRVLCVLDASLGLDGAAVARLLDLAVGAGIAVVWLADDAADVPRQIERVLAVDHADGARMVGRLWATDPSVPDRSLEVEHLRSPVAERVARLLAPVRDASTSSTTTSIPRVAPLLDTIGLRGAGPPAVVARWAGRPTERRLAATIGIDADGPLEVDLVADGPHALVGGTSGAGKSELLRSMVVGLAANLPPSRLNFLFVDYKGGASTQVFGRLPHTVGYVTNLSVELARRALTSLRAELQWRMALMEGRAKDLDEMLTRHPDEAPASLVIVVDEFATLVKEVPEFVAGIVDIAQRGRSLGLHLVLATQRPTGAVDDNILANTNLRISLRMLDRSESLAVIGAPDAADLPVPLRGRAFIRRGPGRLVEFQSAYGGAPVSEDDAERVVVGDFTRPDAAPGAPAVSSRTGPADPASDAALTQLDLLLDTLAEAGAAWGGPMPRRPWRDVLPDVVTLDDLLHMEPSPDRLAGRDVVVGMLDEPERQDQRPAAVDLEASGGLLVYGSGGSGKTTLLRSIAVGIERDGGASTLVFDFASRGLAALRDLPSVIDVVTADDLEAVSRHILVLDAELDHRRRVLAAARAEHLSAYQAAGHAGERSSLRRIVVLVDGFGALVAALLDSSAASTAGGADQWIERLLRIVTDGRQLGVHTIVTSDRRAAIPPRLHGAIGARLVLRHADPLAYADLGVPADRAEALRTPGRAVLDNTTVQLASASCDPSARAQAAAIADLAARSCRPCSDVLSSAALPVDAPFDDVAGVPGAIGVADITGEAVVLDVGWSHAAIVGPPRSGRSTAVVAAARTLAALHDVYAVGPATSPLARGGAAAADRSAFGTAAAVGTLLDRLANLALVSPDGPRIVVCADDLDVLDDPTLEPVWQRLLASERVRLVAAVETRAMVGYTTSTAISELRRARRLLVLQPDDPNEFLQLTGVKPSVRPGLRWPPGRGVLLADREPRVLHIVRRATEGPPGAGRGTPPEFTGTGGGS